MSAMAQAQAGCGADIYVFLSERGSGALQGMGGRVLPAGKIGVAWA